MDDFILKFNEMALEFLTKMEVSFPNEKKISTYKKMFTTLKIVNFRKPVEMFMENLEPFGLQIMSKDEAFFRNDEYVNSAENISGKIGLINYWDDLPDTSKKSIWEYVQLLYILGMQSLNKQEKLTEILKQTNN